MPIALQEDVAGWFQYAVHLVNVLLQPADAVVEEGRVQVNEVHALSAVRWM